MLTLPVNLGSTRQGNVQNAGILELHDEAVVLHMQSHDTLVKEFATEPRTVAIPFDTITEIQYKPALLGCWLEVITTDTGNLAKIPNAKAGTIRMRITRRHRIEAREFQAAASQSIASS